MIWIMLSERSDEVQLSIDGTPPIIEQYDVRFDMGVSQSQFLPIIDVPFVSQPDEILTDNIPAYGTKGLLINRNVKSVFESFEVNNIQYFSARLKNQSTGEVLEPYWIANVVGCIDCIDHDRSDIEYDDHHEIKFINSLALKPFPRSPQEHILRLTGFLPAMIITDTLKSALMKRNFHKRKSGDLGGVGTQVRRFS